MTRAAMQFRSQKSMSLLSRLLLLVRANRTVSSLAEIRQELLGLSREEFDGLSALAQSNHVAVRGFEAFLELISEEQQAVQAEWARSALAEERNRIRRAMTLLSEIKAAFQEHEYNAIVIKSLDHWPDFGSDIDLYTDAAPEDVSELMRMRFKARIDSRSWGDRLACKWNFLIDGVPEAVEIHMGRLGQTGEQVAVASSLLKRARTVLIDGKSFSVPSSSDRLMISTLQRMYRHFYFRLCDVVDTVSLAESGGIDYEQLGYLARRAGIWEGVATFLAIISDYAESYRGSGLDLPRSVIDSARFGGSEIYYGRDFLRVPILPQSARLYGSQLAGVLARRELSNGARLSLLPWLATAAMVKQKLTGSDKGIW